MRQFLQSSGRPLPGSAHGDGAVSKPLATPAQRVRSKLVNRIPVCCPICDRYISPFVGLPVILNDKERIIEFAHPNCCVARE